jgi:hypothetical protein
MELWYMTVDPLLEALRPRVVVEVGMYQGETTQKLLDYVSQHEGLVHGIDPTDPPDFDVTGFRERYGERFVFHNQGSLDVLPQIRDPDFVLLDGDHNWYTVYNELSALAQVAQQESRPFPLTLMHDVDWPWGRRDMYYDPDRIPAEHRQPVTTGGLKLETTDLSERGFAWRVQKAATSGTPQNGVRTAIEDFLAQADVPLRFTSVPGFHGVGVLADQRLLAEPAVAEALATLESPEFLRAHCERLEHSRLWAMVQAAEARQQGNR